jgi:diazepam-binding inhibitor (GABA receptor modulator, acyl-CoA-binding protein)
MTDDLSSQFEDAVNRSRTLPAQSNDKLLELYALYKQATVGDVTGVKPGRLDIKGRAKYQAWEGRKGTSKVDAKRQYIELVDSLAG